MASIADLFIKLIADDRGLEAQVTGSAKRAGDKAGATMGQRLGAGVRAGATKALAVGGVAAATLIGFGTRGLIELDNAMASFQAETGATAEEVDRASDKVLEFSRRNLQPINEIAGTMGALRTQMGLTQEAAENLTEPFLKFAEVTGQTGPDAVAAFDDILDSWNLDAGQAQDIMDKLVKSHQLYGGSVSDNQRTLAQLAPAMQAANFEIDDGISLLNLFGAKGLDARTASAAFSKALTVVKSPEELKQLIADIQSTEDPFERARKAADLFGARAGAKLANALKPTEGQLDTTASSFAAFASAVQKDAEGGFENFDDIVGEFQNNLGLTDEQVKRFIDRVKGGESINTALADLRGELDLSGTSLEDYTVTTEEATGATGAAADAFESSFGRQAQLWIKNIIGMSTGLLQNLGPGIGGIATAAAVGGPALGGLFGLMKSGASSVIPTLVGAIGKIGPAMTLMMGPVGIIIAAVAALFLAWSTNFLGIRDIVGNVVGWFVDNILPILKGAFDFIVSVVGTAVGVVVEVVKVWFAVWSRIIGALVEVVKVAIGVVAAVIGTVVGIVEAMVGGVRTAIGIFTGIFRGVADVIGPIVDTILAPIKGIVGVVGWVAEQVGGFFDWLFGETSQAKADLESINSSTPTGQFTSGNMGGVPTAQAGAWRTTPGLWQLHADEMVVPPGPAQALRDWFGGGFQPVVVTANGEAGNTYQVFMQGLLKARTSAEIGGNLRRLGEAGHLVPTRRMVNE